MKFSRSLHRAGSGCNPPIPRSEPASYVWTSLEKVFPPIPIWHKHGNERSGESLDVQIKGSHQRGSPLTIQQLRRTQKDERLSSALIAPDETVRLKADGVYMRVSVYVRLCEPSTNSSSGSGVVVVVVLLVLSLPLWFQEEKRD